LYLLAEKNREIARRAEISPLQAERGDDVI
jgi:hypothetical protein